MSNLNIDFLGIPCENPFFLSSSVVGSNYEMVARAFEEGWGGVVFKSVATWVPEETSPRFDVTRKESTNFVGLKNLEMNSDYDLKTNMEFMAKLKENYPEKIVASSIMGESEEDWALLAKLSEEAGVDFIECNFSCPQMILSTMGSDVGEDPELVKQFCKVVRESTKLPFLAKLTPNVGHMEPAGIAAMEGGADGLATINTIKSLTGFDMENLAPKPVVDGKSCVSGYSGKAVKPIALRFIHDLFVCKELQGVPISGMGGIETWKDALDFILLGCENVQVTTAVMQYGYSIIKDMISGLSLYMEEKGIEKLSDLVGAGLSHVVKADELDRKTIVPVSIDRDRCIGCGRCYMSCMDGGHQAIEWDVVHRSPEILPDKCVGCHLCKLVCPAQAFRLEARKQLV